jgi:translation initiation factor IF-1
LDPQPLEGRFSFWGVERALDLERPWVAHDLGRSWNYPVHYFEAAPALAEAALSDRDAALRDTLQRWLTAWIDAHPPGRGIAWDSYPTALRIVNWLDAVATLGEWCDPAWRERVMRSVYVQAEWLAGRMERHLLGTHLLVDATALAVAGSVFRDPLADGWRRAASGILARELRRQVHPGGAHVEPSVLYHGIALENVLDLLAFGAVEGEVAMQAQCAAAAMTAYLACVRPPGGGWPLLGDSAVDAEPDPQALLDYAARLGVRSGEARPGLVVHADAGIAVWRDTRQYVLADVGPVGPPHLAGHGHCDSLSFEWQVDGLALVVDSGTRTYEPGAARQASRATPAHNTLEIDGREQHEIWAAFRVARRSAVHARLETGDAVVAELVPWFDARLRVTRRFEFAPGGIRLCDRVGGRGAHRIASRIHLHPDCEARLDGRTLHLARAAVRARIELPEGVPFELLDPDRSGSTSCERFGTPRPNAVLAADVQARLPWECDLVLRVDL